VIINCFSATSVGENYTPYWFWR